MSLFDPRTLELMVERERTRRVEQERAQRGRTRAKRSYRPSGNSDILDLVNALGRAEWGCLSGTRWRGHRAILSTLAALMFDAHRGRSARLVTTAPQIAARAGYSERWVRQLLSEMEELGLVQWQRGGIENARPTPSVIQISKKLLCDWIEDARRKHDANTVRRRAEFAQRLGSIRDRRKTLPPHHILRMNALARTRAGLLTEVKTFANETARLVAEAHAELSASPLTQVREGQGDTPPAPPIKPERNETMYLGKLNPHWLPDSCKHKPGTDPQNCSWCVFEAKTQRTQDIELLRQTPAQPKPKKPSQPRKPDNPALASTIEAMKAQDEAFQASVRRAAMEQRAQKARDARRRADYEKYMEDTYPHLSWRERARLASKDDKAKKILAGELTYA